MRNTKEWESIRTHLTWYDNKVFNSVRTRVKQALTVICEGIIEFDRSKVEPVTEVIDEVCRPRNRVIDMGKS